MTQYSHSRVDLYRRCPYHFNLKYNHGLRETIDLSQANHPLIIGSALHNGIEEGSAEKAVDYYISQYPNWSNQHEEEVMKLEYWVPKVIQKIKEVFGENVEHEYKIDTKDFVGYVDLIVYHDDGTQSIVDFKYSNAVDAYSNSPQLSIYKYYMNKLGFNVKHLYYMFIPKTFVRVRNAKNEQQYNFRNRMIDDMKSKSIQLVEVDYGEEHVNNFFKLIDEIENHTGPWEKNEDEYCFMCNNLNLEYDNAIMEKGKIKMVLPKNKRREKTVNDRPDFWIYAESYVGKSTFVDNVEDVLFINTDGNTDYITAPVVGIADTPKKQGRRTVIEYGWEKFVEVITELASEDHGYKAIAIDLVEDLYELARTYVFNQNGWTHESDGDFGKGWSMVRTEFANAIKRLKMLGFQIIYISKEDVQSIRSKTGTEVDHFKPNIQGKMANFLSGTVDMTVRAYINKDGKRKLQLESGTDSFGGSRIKFNRKVIDLDYDEFLKEIIESQK